MASKAQRRQLSVIVPTYNETDNIRPLATRLFKAAESADLQVELLFMDDESVGTSATERIVEDLQREGLPVRIHIRRKNEGRGLSSAVLLGFDKARYNTVLCMDADLQHEPEAVPAVADPVLRGEAEFSVGSRHVSGGGLGFNWSVIRRMISAGATMLAYPLTTSTDPMSGFFCTTKEVLRRGRHKCNPVGFKIGLEIMARCKMSALPFASAMLVGGIKKLIEADSTQQLVALYWDKFSTVILVVVAVILFAIVALSLYLFQ